MASQDVAASPGSPTYARAWIATLLGFIAVALSAVLWIIYWEAYLGALRGDGWDFDSFQDISRIGSIAGYVFYIGAFLVLLGIVLAISGLMVDVRQDRFIGAIRSRLRMMELLAAVAGVLYLISGLFNFLIGESILNLDSFGAMRLIYYPSRIGDVLLAALVFVVVNELNRRRA
jgi:hypothetical protein